MQVYIVCIIYDILNNNSHLTLLAWNGNCSEAVSALL